VIYDIEINIIKIYFYASNFIPFNLFLREAREALSESICVINFAADRFEIFKIQ
tara:strand:+ start:25610 stop:25771 length:162 start_codon:yes stop_codon:yes gene_type:complete